MDPQMELVDQRHAWLIEQVERKRRVTTTEAATALGISVDTIRRDLRLLHDQGLLRRVHGGAVPIARLPTSFAGRSNESDSSGAVLAAEIVSQFRPGQVIGLDGGSTSVSVAEMIPASLAITVVTNNPAAALALNGHPSATVILLGGHLDLTWMATTGVETVDAWRNYRLDIGVLGLCGLDTETGGTTNSAKEVATKRALIAASLDVIVPVHQDKVGAHAPYVVAGLDAFDTVVTKSPLPDRIMNAMTKHGNQTIVARDNQRL